MKKNLAFFILMSFTFMVHGQKDQRVTLDATESFALKAANGHSYRIDVALPLNHEKSGLRYPVLYILDADDNMGLATELSRLIGVSKDIPEMIVVGISYGAHITQPGNERNRDYAPTHLPDFPGSGQAETFLSFLRDSLVGEIDARYRTIVGDRTIWGTSLGGLFGLYALFKAPELFTRYICTSPAIWWDNQSIANLCTTAPQDRFQKIKRLFMSVGSDEISLMTEPFKNFTALLKMKSFKNLEVQTMVLDGENHMSAGPAGFIKGIRGVYRP